MFRYSILYIRIKTRNNKNTENSQEIESRLGRRILGQEDGLDVGEHAAPRDGDVLQHKVELLIILDS